MKSWIQAIRLRTLPLAFSGWLVGISVIVSYQSVQWVVGLLTLMTAFLLQVLSNLANDLGDASSGVDSERQGEKRMVSEGIISAGAMKRGIVICAGLTLLSGISLLYLAFPEDYVSAFLFLLLGLAGIIAAIKYTVGKNPYGYAGFGDLFVLLFFGFVLVYGTFYLQVQDVQTLPLFPALSVGLFSAAVLNVNNIRDIESDQRAGKFSLPVRIGKKNAVRYHIFLLVGGLLASLVYLLLRQPQWYEFVFLLVAMPFYKNVAAVKSKTGHALDPFLKQMAISTLVFALLFATGQVLRLYL